MRARLPFLVVCAFVLASSTLAQAAPVPVNFTINSTLSSIQFAIGANLDDTFGVMFGDIPGTAQLPGVSDISKVSGSFTANVDLTGSSIDITSSQQLQANTGNWTPAQGGEATGTSAAAVWGHFINLGVVGRIYSAIRDYESEIKGTSTLSGAGPYTFPVTPLTYQIVNSNLDIDGAGSLLQGALPPDRITTLRADNDPPVNFQDPLLPGTLTLVGDQLTMVMPVKVHATALVSGGPDYVTLDYLGTITATGTYTPPAPDLVGDANGDCQVGAADYAIWAAQFGQTGADLSADFDNSGSVGAGDYTLWAANFGNTCPPGGAAVPEPSTWALALLGLVGLLAARKRS